ncbi:MAG TPA: hypothetical protein VFL55_13790 [Acetobacteraceae bacterium]|nr:hypothetical protein [Acetobacteraceae bacterium]
MSDPGTPDNPVAKLILASCVAQFADNRGDCNRFLKAALSEFLPLGYFDGLDADAIVKKLRDPAQGWLASRDIATAIASAKAGDIVVAGMTSQALRQQHGHVAIVIGCDGLPSGGVIVPLGYAGSLGNPAAELDGGRLSGTFAAALVRSGGIDYYCKRPARLPA